MDRNVETDVELPFAQKGFALEISECESIASAAAGKDSPLIALALIIPCSFSKHVDVSSLRI